MGEKLRGQILWQTTQLILAVSQLVLLLSKKFLGVEVDKLLSTLEYEKKYAVALQKWEYGDY